MNESKVLRGAWKHSVKGMYNCTTVHKIRPLTAKARLFWDESTFKLTVDATKCVWFPIIKSGSGVMYVFQPTARQSQRLNLDSKKGKYQACAVAMKLALTFLKPIAYDDLQRNIVNLLAEIDNEKTGVSFISFRKEVSRNLLASVIAHVYQRVIGTTGVSFHCLIHALRTQFGVSLSVEQQWAGFQSKGLFVAGDAFTAQDEELNRQVMEDDYVEYNLEINPNAVPADFDPYA
jgi:hypothetical protein